MTTTSLHDKNKSNEILTMPEVTFYGIFLALIARADTDNLALLEQAFPEVVLEAKIRYYAPGGALTVEEWNKYYTEDDTQPLPEEFLVNQFKKARRQAARVYADGMTPRERDENLDPHNQQ